MKKFVIISAVLLTIINVSAQNYQNICSPGKFLFFRDPEIKAFNADSLVPFGNADTLFISYPAVRDTSGNCLDTIGGSVLGQRIIRYHDGWFNFFNYRHDTIFFNSQANVNDIWKFFKLPDNAYLEAKVTRMAVDSFAGITDSVKVITLQAKNSSGQNISNMFNSKEIHLSQHFGFSQIFDMYLMPNDDGAYQLVGKSQLPIGLQEVTVQELYDFNIGDEFHFTGQKSTNANYTSTDNWKEIWTILDKSTPGSTDSVHYLIKKCRMTLRTFDIGGVINYIKMDSTVNQSYNFLQLAMQPEFTGFPDEYNIRYINGCVHRYYWRTSLYHQRMMKGHYLSINTYGNQCYHFDNSYYKFYEYTSGLGLTKEFQYAVWYGYDNYSQQLVWYKKGQETWGTPVATDCQHLFPYINTDRDTLILASTAMSSDTVMISANYEWTLAGGMPSWLSADSLKGNGNGRVIFRTVEANRDTVIRSANFIFKSPLSADVPITVLQQGKPAGIAEPGDLFPELFPNPTTGLVHFRWGEQVEFVKIFNPFGILLQSIPVHDNTGTLNLSPTGSGLFILRFVTGKREVNLKIIVL